MRHALLIAMKDLRQRVRDRSVILLSVIAPLGLAVIFSQLLAGATEFHADYVVADLDRGSVARAFRDDVLGSLEDGGVATIREVDTEAEARAAVESEDAEAAFIIPAGFSAAVGGGTSASIEVYGAVQAGLETSIAESVATRFGDGVASVQLALGTTAELRGRPLTAEEVGSIVTAATTSDPALQLVDVDASLRQLSWSTYFSASMAILFLFFAAQIGITSLFEERRGGTIARMLAGPVAPVSIILGKAIGAFVTGIVAMTVLIAGTTLLIGADWGPPLGVALIAGAGVLSAIGVATLVASFARTAETAGAASSAVAITLAIFGGSFSPVSQGPEIMSSLSLLTPHAWFLRGLADLHGAGSVLTDALPAVLVLLTIGLVTGGLGFGRAKRLVAVG